jgi:hypothetical protein
VDTTELLQDRYGDQHLVERRRRQRKTVGSGRNWPLPAEERYVALSLHCTKFIFVIDQARSVL